jgi:hypothetical protein
MPLEERVAVMRERKGMRYEGGDGRRQSLVKLEGGRELPDEGAGGPNEDEQRAAINQAATQGLPLRCHRFALNCRTMKKQKPSAIIPSVMKVAMVIEDP